MLNILKNTINRVFASGVDSDASAFITATGLSSTTQKSAITTLVKDLKSSGLWSKMKAVYPMVTDNYNLLSYTEDFSNAAWNKVGLSVIANTTTAPNGTLTADTLIENTATQEHYNSIQLTKSASSLTYTISAYFKNASGTRNFAIAITNGVTAGIGAIFSTSGTVVSSSFNIGSGAGFSAVSATIQDAGNGWYRAIFTTTSDTSTRLDFVSYIVNGTTTNYTGNGTSGIYLWGTQLEQSASISAYQPIATTPSAFMASQMKYNLKDARDLDAAFRLTWSGGWTYSATGATPNGTNAYANTNLNGNSVLTTNSEHISIYSRTDVMALYADIGGADALLNETNIFPNYNNTFYARVQAGNTGIPVSYNTAALFISNRVNSTQVQGWRNNVKNVLANNSTGKVNANYWIGALNSSVNKFYSTRQYAFATIGDGLSDQDAQLLNQIVEKYQVALSRGVQAAQSFYYNSAYSNEANTYLYSTQITGTTQVSAINTLINGLKANNLWSKMKAVYPFVTDKTLQSDMAAQMKFNLVNPQDSDAAFRLAFSGGWTYSTNGAQPNGTNGYADTKLVPSAAIASVNSNSLGYYSGSNLTETNSDPVNMGSFVSATQAMSILKSNTNITSRLNGDPLSYVTAIMKGFFVSTRPSSTVANLFFNGSKVNTITPNGSFPTYSVLIGTISTGSPYPQGYVKNDFRFAFIADGFNDTEASLLYQLVQDYQTTLSRQV